MRNEKYEKRCNNCMMYFESDNGLKIFKDNDENNNIQGFFKGCPECETDAHLMVLR